jgi:hypothetical protein
MAERIVDTLVRAENDLARKVQALRSELAPLEKELAEVRLALAAVSPEDPPGLLRLLEHSDEQPSAYAYMTMKQLALHVLREQFPSGATAADMLAFIANAYDRRIERTSFSPQLTRLREEGQVRRIGNLWRLAEKKNEPSRSGDGPFEGGERAQTRPSLGINKQSPRAGRK